MKVSEATVNEGKNEERAVLQTLTAAREMQASFLSISLFPTLKNKSAT